ncbi:MAG: thymidine kinase [Bdellovibrionales bacterium]|nr:thymidine kinase [Bdellovibrionales bacterium]
MSLYSRLVKHPGWIEVIVGCMYSGKTEELIRQIRRAEIAKQAHQLFKPRIDNRYSESSVASHNQNLQSAIIIDHAYEILDRVNADTEVVGIDEGQFFTNDLVEVAGQLANSGRRVLIAGLDTDWKGRPFGPIPQLMAVAEEVRKQHAICMVCGSPATRTQRLPGVGGQDILVGSDGMYEARCRSHFKPLPSEDSLLTQPPNHGKTEKPHFMDL